ncbi:flavin reductase family protein [Mucilaginibacter galii]|uniref:Flavin oxidoreductase n=1 Tax=Mucilaginibacter galii TaxID=2005073 RepID=A0A917J9Z5_9SPHI|nr:flavin reductase [Mucilaginibacter galii]GGI51553.1 flavin oxidoreductase [Mucilaginibacter galii]
MKEFTSKAIQDMEKRFRTTLINNIPGYKPLQLLGTVSEAGVTNLCLVNSVFHLGANPPLLGLVLRPQREENNTLVNIKQMGVYTLNNVVTDYYKQAHQASATYPSGVSEFEACGFEADYIDGFKAPFVKQSTIKIGLKLREIIDMATNGTTIVVGEIVHILADEQLIGSDGFVDHTQADTVTVVGLDSYYTTQPLERLAYAKPGKNVQIIPTQL